MAPIFCTASLNTQLLKAAKSQSQTALTIARFSRPSPFTAIMSTEIAGPDIVNIDLHRPLAMSSVSPNALISSGNPPLGPTYPRIHDSSHGGFLEGLPHVRARLDASWQHPLRDGVDGGLLP
ncbi:hypothetical protein BJV77DRAFT_968692 [Russula vinacea]|nr:hypothetical protein BJV77DRAFT_968692 [Russula vinacea]